MGAGRGRRKISPRLSEQPLRASMKIGKRPEGESGMGSGWEHITLLTAALRGREEVGPKRHRWCH